MYNLIFQDMSNEIGLKVVFYIVAQIFPVLLSECQYTEYEIWWVLQFCVSKLKRPVLEKKTIISTLSHFKMLPFLVYILFMRNISLPCRWWLWENIGKLSLTSVLNFTHQLKSTYVKMTIFFYFLDSASFVLSCISFSVMQKTRQQTSLVISNHIFTKYY